MLICLNIEAGPWKVFDAWVETARPADVLLGRHPLGNAVRSFLGHFCSPLTVKTVGEHR